MIRPRPLYNEECDSKELHVHATKEISFDHMGNLIEEPSLREKEFVFADRVEAGKKLAEKLKGYKGSGAIVLAIPSGGVPVGHKIKEFLSLDFDLMIARKIHLPWDSESGFGAITLDGTLSLNQALIRTLNMTEKVINDEIKKTLLTLQRRNDLFRKRRDFPLLKDRIVILVDDGLASGSTILACIEFVAKRRPAEVVVAVPTGSLRTVERILPMADNIFCLNIRKGYPYAVANAYKEWHDLTDDEVLRMIEAPCGKPIESSIV